MPTETETVSLRDYFDRVMQERDKALSAALASAKEAVMIAEANSERWRSNSNEWRATLGDRDQAFLTKAEFFQYRESVAKSLKEFADFKEARSGVLADIDSLNKDVRALNTFKDSMDGKASQKGLTTMTIVSFISLGLALIGVLLRLLGM